MGVGLSRSMSGSHGRIVPAILYPPSARPAGLRRCLGFDAAGAGDVIVVSALKIG